MKKILICLSALAIVACKDDTTKVEAPKDYVTLSGTITNKSSDSIVVRNREFTKTIKVGADGTFSDTLKVETGLYSIYDGNEQTTAFLKNGYDLNLTLDTKMFDETVKFSGNGAEHSNFLAEKVRVQERLLDVEKLAELDSLGLEESMKNIEKELLAFYDKNQTIDTSLTNNAANEVKPMLNFYKRYVGEKIALKRDLPKGAPSPTFENYENYKGGTTSLKDLKGKYVYVDIWATWCGPCKAEIPSLKKLEKEYHGKNIEFVSISTDNGRGYRAETPEEAKKLAYDGWRKMVEEKELGGVQLMSDKAFESEFVRAYKINAIPRFLLIDPAGNIVDADAPRPSEDKLIELFNSLEI